MRSKYNHKHFKLKGKNQMKTKKLTKKQLNILQGVNDSLETSRIVLKKYEN